MEKVYLVVVERDIDGEEWTEISVFKGQDKARQKLSKIADYELEEYRNRVESEYFDEYDLTDDLFCLVYPYDDIKVVVRVLEKVVL